MMTLGRGGSDLASSNDANCGDSTPSEPSSSAVPEQASLAAVMTQSFLRNPISPQKFSENCQRIDHQNKSPVESNSNNGRKVFIKSDMNLQKQAEPDGSIDNDGKQWLDGPAPTLSRCSTSGLSSSSASDNAPGSLIECEDLAALVKRDYPDTLIVDVRPSAEYVERHVKSAVSICFPTTLLKRPKFTVSKLLHSLAAYQNEEEIKRLRQSDHVVIYDSTSSSTSIKPCSTVSLTKNKFSHDPDVPGEVSFLNGGFEKFQAQFPELVDKHEGSKSKKNKVAKCEDVPYIGASKMEPFYHNIRQNTDMIDLAEASGVGKMMANKKNIINAVDCHCDEDTLKKSLPGWLYFAISEEGSWYLGQRFYSVERAEQKRMRRAMLRLMDAGKGPMKPVSPNGISISNAISQGNRNRYHNVYSFDQTRVRLDMGMTDSSNDYINANYLSIPGSTKRYIACQAPLKNTARDFWGMVWQEGIRTIAMLSAVEEAGAKKCDVYWDEGEYGPFVLNMIGQKSVALDSKTQVGKRECREDGCADIIEMEISHGGEARRVRILQYGAWPDLGCPSSPLDVVHLSRIVEELRQEGIKDMQAEGQKVMDVPTIVHCSAGCGRSGTFCTVDSVIDMVKNGKQEELKKASQLGGHHEHGGDKAKVGNHYGLDGYQVDDLFDEDVIGLAVEHLRMQRMSMVQTLRQFIICYENVAAWMLSQE